MDQRDDVLTADEINAVTLALLDGKVGAGATDEEMEAAAEWARKARIGAVLLDLVLSKAVVMRPDAGGGFRFVAREHAVTAVAIES